MTRLRLPVLVLTGLVLVGCGSEPVPDQLAAPAVLPSPSAGVSTAPAGTNNPDSPTASPASPEAPVQSSELSPAIESSPTAEQVAEVEQFVRDYYAAINRAQYEGDVARLETFSLPECNCRILSDDIRADLPLGRTEGAAWIVESVEVEHVSEEVATVRSQVQVDDGRIVTPDGETALVLDNLGRAVYEHALLLTGSGWKMVQVSPL